ncbi:MAG: hypothetical protein A3J76_00145 [Candidatus Moranbacteria bacterium RBG_13_45_13]|nr:MAG: hypothetical protein A3J76_00145 [Candidatus Moranbacteria bacterium RBG_13_45_13]
MEGEKKKILMAVGGAALFVGFLGWFSFFWQIGSIGNKFEEIQRVKLESLVWQEKLKQVSMLKKELPQIEEQSGEIEKMFVSRDDAVSLFQALEKAAALSGTSVKVDSVDLAKLKIGKAKPAPKKVEEDENTKAAKDANSESAQAEKQSKESSTSVKLKNMLGLSIEVTGNYSSLVDFLKRMEGSPYFIQVLIIDAVPVVQKSQTGASQSGVLPQSGQPDQSSSPQEGTDLKMNLTVAVYTNETK